jgi:polyvinyl alcohol dehydrogenase (cytochrome)
VPASVLACETSHPNTPNCQSTDDHFDAALALDLQTGAIRWSRQLQGYDVWTVGCNTPTKPGVTCEMPKGPDNDLGGSGGNLLTNFVGFGQKSGMYWALHPDTGVILWDTRVGPGGSLGGIQWGTATDGQRIYVAVANSNHQKDVFLSGQTVTWGFWAALDATTGKILWQTPDPAQGAVDTGALSVANGVVYAGSMEGHMYALDAASGTILWSFASGGSVNDGPAIVDGVVYWGSGYPHGGTNNNKVYAFTVTQ